MANQTSLDTKLIRAVRNENINEIKTLLDAGANINAVQDESLPLTPLIIAAQSCNIEIAELLIKRGADVNLKGGTWIGTPLLEAATKSSEPQCFAIMNLFIEHGANVNLKSGGYDATPLHMSAHSGNLEACELLIKKGADINSKSKRGATPLHSACISGHPTICKLLIESGADIDAEDNKGDTPLFYSTSNYYRLGNTIPQLLYDFGANFLHKNKEGKTALQDIQGYGGTIEQYTSFKELEDKYRKKAASAKGLALLSAASQFPNLRPGKVAWPEMPDNAIQEVTRFLNLKNKLNIPEKASPEIQERIRQLRRNRNTRLAAARQAVAEEHAAKVSEQQGKATREGWYGWMGGVRKHRKTRGKKRKNRTMKKHRKN
jgi:hypothetical protein